MPAGAGAGLVPGGARRRTPCPPGQGADGERAELAPGPPSSHCLSPGDRPSQPLGANLPSPAPRPWGPPDGWGVGSLLQAQDPGSAETGTLLPVPSQAASEATCQEAAAGKSCPLPSPGWVGGVRSGHGEVLGPASPLQGRRTPCPSGPSQEDPERTGRPPPASPQNHIPFPIIFPDSVLYSGC